MAGVRLTGVAPLRLDDRFLAAAEDPQVATALAAASRARAFNLWCGACVVPLGGTLILLAVVPFGQASDASKLYVLGGLGGLLVGVGLPLFVGAWRMRRAVASAPHRIAAFLVGGAVAHGTLCVPLIAVLWMFVIRSGRPATFLFPALGFLAIPAVGILANLGTHLRYATTFRSFVTDRDRGSA